VWGAGLTVLFADLTVLFDCLESDSRVCIVQVNWGVDRDAGLTVLLTDLTVFLTDLTVLFTDVTVLNLSVLQVNWTSIGVLCVSWIVIAVFSILKGGEVPTYISYIFLYGC
jgi:hypothetical protein